MVTKMKEVISSLNLDSGKHEDLVKFGVDFLKLASCLSGGSCPSGYFVRSVVNSSLIESGKVLVNFPNHLHSNSQIKFFKKFLSKMIVVILLVAEFFLRLGC